MIKTNDKAIRTLARIIFKHGYSLGAFSGDNSKVEKGYDMMIKHMIDTDIQCEEMKKLLEALLK